MLVVVGIGVLVVGITLLTLNKGKIPQIPLF